ncbi:hypothetical protein ACIPR7_18140 [Pectobacterium parvum]|uniref:hypothetical protein n=1 Tax=Pectobacterium TaxID=122277 RepID=UPI0005C61EEA|nr:MULTISPECIES: hypothetical protein [Pectobacterium]AZK61360.1 hypothetical protein EIP93_03060 [Pectobacterium versatile]MCU1793484.1 hypothetical protein [Pectobacterium polaris]QQG29336.1 hypothetical protein JFY74_04525 [Pectobacterium carotovorum]
MGSVKELLFEAQEAQRDEWIAEHYPEAEEGTEAFDAAGLAHDWMLDALVEDAERQWFQDSLNDLDDRYRHAVGELNELNALMISAQSNIALRLAYAHTVTVMEAFLMYSARALLSDPAHLERFDSRVAPRFRKSLAQYKTEVLRNTQKQADGTPSDGTNLECRTAQLFVSRQTFHNLAQMNTYFRLVLKTPPEWPIDPLVNIVATRQHLVHRNGVSNDDEPVSINSWHLAQAIEAVRLFIDAVALTLRQETGADSVLPVVHPKNTF